MKKEEYNTDHVKEAGFVLICYFIAMIALAIILTLLDVAS